MANVLKMTMIEAIQSLRSVGVARRRSRAADRRRSASRESTAVTALRGGYFLAKYRTSGKPLKSSSSVQTVAHAFGPLQE